MEHYCLMVKSGGEEAFKKDFEKNLRKVSEQTAQSVKTTFFKKKMRDSQKKEFEQSLFPGYVFLSTKEFNSQIVEAAKQSKNFYHFLNSNSNIQALRGNDRQILANLLKFGETQGISKVWFDQNQKILIASGPLAGFEGKIIKVNKKRGRATVQVDLFNNAIKFDLAFDEIKQRPETASIPCT